MFNRTISVAAAMAISAAISGAKDDSKPEQCPTRELGSIVDLIREAPSCRRAVSVFEVCAFGASGDVALGTAATEKCEVDFSDKLSASQKLTYERKQKRCASKYENKVGTMYRSFEAFCGAYVARDYSDEFLTAAHGRKSR
jgi:hypothetical protein